MKSLALTQKMAVFLSLDVVKETDKKTTIEPAALLLNVTPIFIFIWTIVTLMWTFHQTFTDTVFSLMDKWEIYWNVAVIIGKSVAFGCGVRI